MDDNELDKPARSLTIHMQHGETEEQAGARAALTPAYHASMSLAVINQGTPFAETDVTALANLLEQQTSELQGDDLSSIEGIVSAQVVTLDALFHKLLRRAVLNMGEHFNAASEYAKLALKAQSQCGAAVDRLVSIKRPPINQTNIAHGHQQVNNFPPKNPPNELMEQSNERMDGRATETPGRTNSDLEAVGAINGAKVA